MDSANCGSNMNNKKIPVVIATGIFLVAFVVVVVFNFGIISIFFHKNFTSPTKYYQYIEEKSIDNFVSVGAGIYNSVFLEKKDISDHSGNGTVALELTNRGKSYLGMAKLAGIDLTWLENITINYGTSIIDSIASINATIEANDIDVVSGNFIMDLGNNNLYIQIPEIADKYLGISLNDFLSSDEIEELQEFENTQNKWHDIINAYPTQEEAEQLANKYLKLVVSNIDEVTKNSTTISVQDVSQKCTQLSYTVDSSDIERIADSVLTTVKQDSDIERIIRNIAKATETDEDETYSKFIEDIENRLEKLCADNDDELEIVVNVYVNAMGGIIGRMFEYSNGGYDDCVVTMLLPENNGEFGCELSYIDESMYNGGRSIRLVGKGTREGYNINGDFTVKYQELQLVNEYKIVNIGVDCLNLNDLERGYVNGNFELIPCGDLSEINSNLSYIEDFKLNVTSEMDKDTLDCSIELNYGIDDLGALTIFAKTGNGDTDTAIIPANANTVMISNPYGVIKWISEVNLTSVIDNLKSVGVQQEWIDELENIYGLLGNRGQAILIK